MFLSVQATERFGRRLHRRGKRDDMRGMITWNPDDLDLDLPMSIGGVRGRVGVGIEIGVGIGVKGW